MSPKLKNTTTASDNDEGTAGALVIHGPHATLFGAVGMPVPANACMGVAEAAAAAALERPDAEDRGTRVEVPAPRASAFRWATAPGRGS